PPPRRLGRVPPGLRRAVTARAASGAPAATRAPASETPATGVTGTGITTTGVTTAGVTATGGDGPGAGQAAERPVPAQQLHRLEQRRADLAPGDRDPHRPAERRLPREAQPVHQ